MRRRLLVACLALAILAGPGCAVLDRVGDTALAAGTILKGAAQDFRDIWGATGGKGATVLGLVKGDAAKGTVVEEFEVPASGK